MKRMNASEFKAKCLKILDDVERTGEPVLILKRGRVVARLMSPLSRTESAPWKTLRGKMDIVGDIVGPAAPAEDWNAVRGEGS